MQMFLVDDSDDMDMLCRPQHGQRIGHGSCRRPAVIPVHGASANMQAAGGTPKSKLTQFGSRYGNKVVLEGKVDSWEERHAVENAAWSAPGVKSVEDRTIGPFVYDRDDDD